MEDVANLVRNKGVIHIGLAVWGQNGNTRAVRDLTAFGDGSGSYAPAPVDCDPAKPPRTYSVDEEPAAQRPCHHRARSVHRGA